MTHPLLDRLASGPVLADGAIGTMLYEAGASLDQSFDALNLTLPDLVLGVSSAVTALAADGVLDPSRTAEIAVSAVGFARLAGSPAPAEASEDAFLEYLLAARAVAYTLSGASGLHFMKVLRERGLLERIDERAVRFESGLTVDAVLDGRADVAIQQISELRSVSGAQIVEPIPHELQSYGRFAVGARPGAGEDAARFVTLLTEASAQDAFAAVGLSRP